MDQARGAHDPSGGKDNMRILMYKTADMNQRALADQPWKEYSAEGGRKYWYNTESKQSSWEMPAAFKDALSKQAAPPQAPVQT